MGMKDHWLYRGEQDSRIEELFKQGLGATRIHRKLQEEFGRGALSFITVTRRITDLRNPPFPGAEQTVTQMVAQARHQEKKCVKLAVKYRIEGREEVAQRFEKIARDYHEMTTWFVSNLNKK